MKNRKITCKQCGYDWTPKVEKPVKCPNCYSEKYNKRK